jgi:hypothetical protein
MKVRIRWSGTERTFQKARYGIHVHYIQTGLNNEQLDASGHIQAVMYTDNTSMSRQAGIHTYRQVQIARYKFLGADTSQVPFVRFRLTIPDNQLWIDSSDKLKQPNTYRYRQLITDNKVQKVRRGQPGTVRQAQTAWYIK